MNPIQPFALVSALDCPLQHSAYKRQFQPASNTIFGDIRRRKLENGVVNIKAAVDSRFCNVSPFGNFHGPAGQFVFGGQGRSASRSSADGAQFEPRQKFKARPIPKSLYHPHKLQITAADRPITIPQDFNLSFSPSEGSMKNGRSGSFKARPMPNFSKPWAPQYSTPVKSNNPDQYEEDSNCFSGFNKTHTPLPYSKRSSFSTPFKNGHSRSSSGFEETKNHPIKEFEPTIPMEIELHTTKRAQDREIFQEKLRENQRIKEAEQKLANELKQRQEEEALRIIRKQTEFKARPMPTFNRSISWTKDKKLEDQSTAFGMSLNNTMMDIE